MLSVTVCFASDMNKVQLIYAALPRHEISESRLSLRALLNCSSNDALSVN